MSSLTTFDVVKYTKPTDEVRRKRIQIQTND